MTPAHLLELLLAVALIGAGIWYYRRPRGQGDSYGGQGAVLLMFIGAIVAIHALGLMDYRPSPSELEGRGQ